MHLKVGTDWFQLLSYRQLCKRVGYYTGARLGKWFSRCPNGSFERLEKPTRVSSAAIVSVATVKGAL